MTMTKQQQTTTTLDINRQSTKRKFEHRVIQRKFTITAPATNNNNNYDDGDDDYNI